MSFLAIKLSPDAFKSKSENLLALTGLGCKVDQLSHGLLTRACNFSPKINWIETDQMVWIRPEHGAFENLFLFVGDEAFPWKQIQKIYPTKQKQVFLAGDFSEKEKKDASQVFSKIEFYDLAAAFTFEGLC